ncbi:hypothetical protein NQ315_005890 [Exocentrus adspersus]|uniref:p-glycoprotein n=1 Tax=Exocentrus adspersus TaxID=1586481 RepID=A0AAV8V964_9CUCU|nr:hypothetical protein NQ315_005890 [Exocentrus adspersus]
MFCLFSDTTAANIAFSNTGADMDLIKHVAKLADAHHFIEALSDGYNTIVGEHDTTSAVDMATEYKIQQDLQKVGANKTAFIIAHRVSSVKDADLILVLNKGEIIELGNHKTLMAKDGYYASNYNEQIGQGGDE